MNLTVHIGYLTRNVEMRKDRNGGDIASFTLAIPRRKNKEGIDTGADYLNVVAFGNRAMTCYQYLERGMRVGIRGHLRSRSYIKNDSGIKVNTMEIVVDDISFLSYKKNDEETESRESSEADVLVTQNETVFGEEDEDLPFDKVQEDAGNEL